MRRVRTERLILEILLIVVILLGAIFYFGQKREVDNSIWTGKPDYQQQSLAIIEVVNEFLSEEGFQSSLMEEKAERRSRGEADYFLNFKVIKLSPRPRLRDYTDLLIEKVEKEGGRIFSLTAVQKGREEIFTLRGGIGPLETFWLIFRQPLLPQVSIIIDDLGYGGKVTEQILTMKVPLTLSVLPKKAYSRDIAARAKELGFQILLHLPMEPYGYPREDPGPGALFVEMEEEKIRETLINDLGEVPGVVGVNNHMGSRFTAQEEKMALVLEELKKQGLFFVDSRTSNHSVAYHLAKTMGLPVTYRNVFLDTDQRAEMVKINIRQLVALALKEGKAIAIGHPYPTTITVLQEMLPELQEVVEVVPVSQLLEAGPEPLLEAGPE